MLYNNFRKNDTSSSDINNYDKEIRKQLNIETDYCLKRHFSVYRVMLLKYSLKNIIKIKEKK